MGTLLTQELYKIVHKTGTWIAVVVMVLAQVGMAVLRHAIPTILGTSALVVDDYLAAPFITFIIIAAGAGIIAMEFQYGTIKQVLYRQYYRSQVFISKILALLIQLLALEVIASLFTFGLTLLDPKFSWSGHFSKSLTYLQAYGISKVGEFLSLILILSVVLLLATLFKTNAAAIVVGIVGYFVLQIASGIMLAAIDRWHFLKWNPLTFLMTGSQLLSPGMKSATHLDTPVMVVGTLVYTVIITYIAYLSFRKRSV